MEAMTPDILFSPSLIPPLGLASAVLLLLSLIVLFLRHRGGETPATKPVSINGAAAAVSSADEPVKPRCVLLYGTQTGTAERFAKQLKSELLLRYGDDTVFEVIDAEEYKAEEQLVKEHMVFLLLATYGDGEPTDNAAEFYIWLVKAAQQADSSDEDPILKVTAEDVPLLRDK